MGQQKKTREQIDAELLVHETRLKARLKEFQDDCDEVALQYAKGGLMFFIDPFDPSGKSFAIMKTSYILYKDFVKTKREVEEEVKIDEVRIGEIFNKFREECDKLREKYTEFNIIYGIPLGKKDEEFKVHVASLF